MSDPEDLFSEGMAHISGYMDLNIDAISQESLLLWFLTGFFVYAQYKAKTLKFWVKVEE